MLEARDRIGGRTWTRTFEGHDDIVVEAGAAYLNLRGEKNLRAEIERYGVAVRPPEGRVEQGRFVVDGGLMHGLPVPLDQMSAIERVIVRLTQDVDRISPTIPLADQPIADLDVSVAEYLGRLELPHEAHDFVTGALAGWIQCDAEETSMLGLLTSILSCGGSPVDTFFGTFGQTFANGTQELVNALAEGLEVRFESQVASVVQEDARVVVTTTSGDVYSGATCVMAAPAWTLGAVNFSPPLDPDKLDLLKREHHVKGVKKLFLVEGAPPGIFGVGGHRAHAQWLMEDRVLPDGRSLLVAFCIDPTLVDAGLEEAQAVVSEFIPEATVVAVDGHDWYGDPLTRGIVGFCPTGTFRQFAQTLSRPHGDVVFAGAELTTNATFWGWMEGAVESGHAAAQQVNLLVGGRR